MNLCELILDLINLLNINHPYFQCYTTEITTPNIFLSISCELWSELYIK